VVKLFLVGFQGTLTLIKSTTGQAVMVVLGLGLSRVTRVVAGTRELLVVKDQGALTTTGAATGLVVSAVVGVLSKKIGMVAGLFLHGTQMVQALAVLLLGLSRRTWVVARELGAVILAEVVTERQILRLVAVGWHTAPASPLVVVMVV
jgi:hypothetical protein